MSDLPEVRIVRHYDAPIERVWEACTEPSQLLRWMSPAPLHDCVVEADVRVGGRFFFRMTGEPGTFAAEGVYRDVVPQRRLSLTWTWTEGPPDEPPDGVTSLLSFDLSPEAGGTRFTLTHTRLPDRRRADSHRQGWSECLDKLAGLLARGPADGHGPSRSSPPTSPGETP